jgi:hypothetical protein
LRALLDSLVVARRRSGPTACPSGADADRLPLVPRRDALT